MADLRRLNSVFCWFRSLLILSVAMDGLWGQATDPTPPLSKDLFALQWRTGERWPADKSPSNQLASIPGAKVEESARLATFGIVLLVPLPDAKAEDLVARLAEFLRSTKDWLPVPVFHSSGFDQVPTTELIVRFRAEITPAQAELFLVNHHLRIIEQPSSLAPNRYLVRANVPASRINEVKSQLDHQAEIRYVDVNFVVVRQFDQQKGRPKGLASATRKDLTVSTGMVRPE